MLKGELEADNNRLRKKNVMMRETLVDIRQIARDFVRDQKTISNVWLIEKITETLTKEKI